MRLKEARARTKFGQSFLYLQISGQTDSPGGAKDFYSSTVRKTEYRPSRTVSSGFMCGMHFTTHVLKKRTPIYYTFMHT